MMRGVVPAFLMMSFLDDEFVLIFLTCAFLPMIGGGWRTFEVSACTTLRGWSPCSNGGQTQAATPDFHIRCIEDIAGYYGCRTSGRFRSNGR
jgi:hypothetical protein